LNDDTDVLSTVDDQRDDGLAEELARVAPRRWWNKATVVLGAAVLLVGGFAGGLQVQKHWGTAATASTAAAGFGAGQNRAGNGAAAGGFPGGAGTGTGRRGTTTTTAAAAGTTGTVKLVDGSTIYVQTANGDIVTVRTNGNTTVSTVKKGRIADVKAGQSVTVNGSTGSDGIVTATSVTTRQNVIARGR
jgi:hypothetical protein